MPAEPDEEQGEIGSHGEPVEDTECAFLALALDPMNMVNFSHLGVPRYLQVPLSLSYQDEALLEEIESNTPAVRNAPILLSSNQGFEKLNSMEGNEEIRAEMKTAINHIVRADEDTGEIDFTKFVMQQLDWSHNQL